MFPLHKIIHLWDKLILGDNSYPLFVGISVLQQLKNTLLASDFNECILLFSDLPDIVMETCVVATQRMYASTLPSIAFRKHVLHASEPGEFDIADQRLDELEAEMCPRISASDVLRMVRERADGIAVLDLRSASEFRRAHLAHSVNVPFSSLLLADGGGLEECCSEVPDLRERTAGRLVVVMSAVHENAVQVRRFGGGCLEAMLEQSNDTLCGVFCGDISVQQVSGRLRRCAGVHAAQGIQYPALGGAQHSGDVVIG